MDNPDADRRSVLGSSLEAAVAYGIAIECREQLRRDPRLATSALDPCILGDLYLAVAKGRRDQPKAVRVKSENRGSGKVVSTPIFPSNNRIDVEIELPVDCEDHLFYYFTSDPPGADAFERRLNITDYSIQLPQGRVRRKATIALAFDDNGDLCPTFTFTGKGRRAEGGEHEDARLTNMARALLNI